MRLRGLKTSLITESNHLAFMKQSFLFSFLSAILLFGAGCKHYQLGSPSELPFTVVYLEPARNESFAPQAQALVSQQVAERLLRSGQVKLGTEAEADAVLSITLTQYEREISATQEADTSLAEGFNLKLVADVTLTSTKTGQDYFKNRTVKATQRAYLAGGFQNSEYQVTPVLTDSLAEEVVNTVLSTW